MLKRVLFVGVLLLCATPAIGKDLHCTPKGGCSDQIRVPW